MTDPNYTGMLLVIDRSGSMARIRDDMVGGLTTMLATQAAEPGKLTVDIVTFDEEIEQQVSLGDPAKVKIKLVPRGSTALYDAIGVAVSNYGQVLEAMPEEKRPGVVQVVVVTDGKENASKEYTADAVRELVKHQTDVYNWDFVYLGANQDAVLTSAALGFAADSAMTYAPAAANVDALTTSIGRYVTDVRKSAKKGFTEDERTEAIQTQ